MLNTITHRFGVLSEAGFREAMEHVVGEAFGAARVGRRVVGGEEELVYGYSSDAVMEGREHMLVEAKSRVDARDIVLLARKAKLYEETWGMKPRAVILGGYVSPFEDESKLGVDAGPCLGEE
ncbi:MAG: DUF3782 domain-containing protein [Pyrodictiaceae archaeon]